MEFLQRLLGGCAHKWETDETVPLAAKFKFRPHVRIVGTRYYQHCKRCGDVRKRDITL